MAEDLDTLALHDEAILYLVHHHLGLLLSVELQKHLGESWVVPVDLLLNLLGSGGGRGRHSAKEYILGRTKIFRT